MLRVKIVELWCYILVPDVVSINQFIHIEKFITNLIMSINKEINVKFIINSFFTRCGNTFLLKGKFICN